MRKIIIVLGLLASVFALSALKPSQKKGYEFRYHNYAESLAILEQLASEYPGLTKLYSIGKSVTGKRNIWCMEIGNQTKGNAENKPASYFDGNQHDIEVTGGEVTLYLAYYMLTNYGKDPDITNVIDTRVTYIIQRADPDGADAFINGKVDWDVTKVPGAADADKDGKIGEDGPEDINGDGKILKIRIKDPAGEWKCHPDDPRIMIRKSDEDATGTFYKLLAEGIDNDGDGKVNEDPPRTRFISNRNYPAYWSTDDGRFRGAGDYPLQEHNSRVLADFIVSKPHISVLESYHTTCGIHLRPYAAKPDTDFPPRDLQDYHAVLSEGTRITTYPTASIYNDFTDVDPALPWDKQPDARHGVFIDWTYVHLGIFSVTTELWTIEPFLNETGWGDIPRYKRFFAIPEQYNRPDAQVQVLKWLDLHKNDPDLAGQGFIDWQSFTHPTLGDVEIGGFTQYWLFNPPPGPFLQKVVEDQAKFSVYRAGITPLVKISDVEVIALNNSENYWEVTATVENEGYLDTSTQQARNANIAKPDELTIELNGDARTGDPLKIEFPFMHGTRGASFVSKYRGTWHIHGSKNSKATIIIRSVKGGTDTREIELK
jgi:hypothetical protein